MVIISKREMLSSQNSEADAEKQKLINSVIDLLDLMIT
jgi:hypothetical protein